MNEEPYAMNNLCFFFSNWIFRVNSKNWLVGCAIDTVDSRLVNVDCVMEKNDFDEHRDFFNIAYSQINKNSETASTYCSECIDGWQCDEEYRGLCTN